MTAGEKADVIRVSEMFGPTIQGEGVLIGLPPESCVMSCHMASTLMGAHWSRYSLSTACSVSHHEQR